MSFLKRLDAFLTDRVGGAVVKAMGITPEDIARAQREAARSTHRQPSERPYNPSRPAYVRPWDDFHDFE